MSRIFGYVVGVVWLGLAFGALRNSLGGWEGGNSDIGFWWGVIAAFLAIAAVGAMVGTFLHTRPVAER